MRSMTASVSQALTGRAGNAYRRLMEHCATCEACKPEVDLVGRAVGIPAECPIADGLRQAWSSACKEAR